MAWSFVADRGGASDATAGATVGSAPSANLAAGVVVFVLGAAHVTTASADGATTTHGVTDSVGGNTWTRLFEVANSPGADDHSVSLWVSKLANGITTSDTITFNSGDTNSLGKTIDIAEFAVASGKTWAAAAGSLNSTIGAGASLTVTSGTVSSAERLWLGVGSFASNSGTPSLDNASGDYTEAIGLNGAPSGVNATSTRTRAGYRIATLTSDGYTSGTGATREGVVAIIALDEVDAGGSSSILRQMIAHHAHG